MMWLMAAGLALAQEWTVVAPSGLYVRESPSRSSEAQTLLPFGEEVLVLDRNIGGWWLVESREGEGYLNPAWLSSFPPGEGQCESLEEAVEAQLGEVTRVVVRMDETGTGSRTRHDFSGARLEFLEGGSVSELSLEWWQRPAPSVEELYALATRCLPLRLPQGLERLASFPSSGVHRMQLEGAGQTLILERSDTAVTLRYRRVLSP